jgi:hypothetical protein
MSKSDDKVRPVQERLAALEGSAAQRDLREGFGGWANITMHDIMAGLAIMRTLAAKEAAEIGDNHHELEPEVLETYFGSTQRYRRLLVRKYLEDHRVEVQYIPAHRMGATLAAQMMAGVSFTHEQEAEFAFICNVRLTTILDLRASAIRWYNGILDNGIPIFGEALRQIIEQRETKRRAGFLEANIANEIKAQLKAQEKAIISNTHPRSSDTLMRP